VHDGAARPAPPAPPAPRRFFAGTSKTRERLGLVEELLTFWSLDDYEAALEELEEGLIGAGACFALRCVLCVRPPPRSGGPHCCALEAAGRRPNAPSLPASLPSNTHQNACRRSLLPLHTHQTLGPRRR